MGNSLTWTCMDTEPYVGGVSGGDYQVKDDITIRFKPEEQPDDGEYAFITETYIVEDMDAFEGKEPEEVPEEERRFGVTLRIEYLVCTDPDDLGGTEVHSDYDYEYQPEERIFRTADDAFEAAMACARHYISTGDGHYTWDGRS